MARYIDADALIDHIKDVPTWWADGGGYYPGAMKYPDGMYDPEDVISSIENAPTEDVAPVVHGSWIPFVSEVAGNIQYCSICSVGNPNKTDYCPHCGARMHFDGGD